MSDLLAAQRAKETTFCANCQAAAGPFGSREVKLSLCAKCKSVKYCSKECQRKHWPTHKQFCGKDQEKTSDLLASFVSSDKLQYGLASYAIVALGLDPREPKPKVEDPLHRFRVELGLVPVDESQSTHLEIARASNQLSKEIEMMLDVKSIEKLDTNAPIHPQMAPQYRAVEEGARRVFAKDYAEIYTVVILEVFAPSNSGTNLPNTIAVIPLFHKNFVATALVARGQRTALTPEEMLRQLNGLIRRSDEDPSTATAVRRKMTVQEIDEYWVNDEN